MVPSMIIERRIKFDNTFEISDYNPYDEKAIGFVIYFPAVTSVFTGLSMRVNIAKNDIFRGTAMALVLSSLLYIVTAVLEARFISLSPLVNINAATLHHGYYTMALLKSLPVTAVVILSCTYCAYTVLITAARLVQDVGHSDGLVPGWDKLGRGYGRENAPRIAFTVITVVGILFSMIGAFNIIASIVTIFFLTTYCLFNYIVFMATLKSDRPVFRYYNRWLALPFFTFLKFYIYIKWKQSKSQIANERIGSSFDTTLSGLQDMERDADPGYKPQVLLLTGNPAARPALVDFANNIIMGRSLLICGFVIPQSTSSSTVVITKKVHKQMSEWLESRHVKAFPATVANKDQVEGAITLLQSSGVGKMRPNILMLGFKTNWEKLEMDKIIEYYEIVLNAFENDVGVAIFRNSNIGFDLTERFGAKNSTIAANADENGIDFNPYPYCNNNDRISSPSQRVSKVGDTIQSASINVKNNNVVDIELTEELTKTRNRFELDYSHSVIRRHNDDLVGQLERFRTRIQKGTIGLADLSMTLKSVDIQVIVEVEQRTNSFLGQFHLGKFVDK
ncbi:hypothetical protein KIN20_000517 [Parelaphostrongylus tenuis]|uniref:SLC12A transporter C-terminal domain-containing protein n=1 Tax=Parelaphostrongylus tenuis TaxID=148309 RepID=A0AAD5LW90_PARTN|nr:hypothetical protein KIN20_000517 [Parelaphostrongylus tenuis]